MSTSFYGQTLVERRGLLNRYFRIQLEFTPNSEKVEPRTAGEEPQKPQYCDIEGAIAVTPDAPTIRFNRFGRCIYCGTTEYAPGANRPLGEEHIISEGLGGTLIFPEASCRECEGATSAAETSVLGDSFWAPRHKLRLRMKPRRMKRTKFPVIARVDGRDVRFSLPLDTHPTMLFLLQLWPPGILAAGQSGISGFWLRGLNDLSKAKMPHFCSPTIDTLRLCQFLAKTGHSLVIAILGGESFIPLLSSFIRRRFSKTEQWPECYKLIGGEPATLPSRALHEIRLGFVQREATWYVTAHMRFFGNLGGPNYVAVVGELKPGITPELAVSRAAVPTIVPEHMSDKIPSLRS